MLYISIFILALICLFISIRVKINKHKFKIFAPYWHRPKKHWWSKK